MTVCKHCGAAIRHYQGRLWHDNSVVFPQYCPNAVSSGHGSRLHEPAEPVREGPVYTFEEVIAWVQK